MTTKDLGSSSYYVIYSANEAQMLDGSGFWSNEAGWTGLEDATLFTEEERAEFALPESTGGDAVWQLHDFLQQIESGNLPLDKIVDKLVDYGLMERKDFLAEMSERMQRN